MSCIFWFVQTLIIGVGSFEVKFIVVLVRLTLVHRYCVSTKLHQTQSSKIILNLRASDGGFSYLVTGLSLVAPHIPLTTQFLHLSTVRISIFVIQTISNGLNELLGIPGISNIVNWYTNASSYATQCLIFGATVGVHTAEAMFVKHMAFMKVNKNELFENFQYEPFQGVFSGSQRWMWWFQTLWFGLPSTKLMVNYQSKGKQN